MPTWVTEPESLGKATEERRYEVRIETRFEAVWSGGRLWSAGILRNLSPLGAFIDEVSIQPPIGAKVWLLVVDEKQEDPLVVDGVVVRRTTSGFSVGIHPANSDAIRLLLDRLAESDPPG